jgi:hypothetical protein
VRIHRDEDEKRILRKMRIRMEVFFFYKNGGILNGEEGSEKASTQSSLLTLFIYILDTNHFTSKSD